MGTIIRTSLATFVALLGMLCTLSSQAGTINYNGPMPGPGGMTGWLGDDVWYGGVSESNTVGTGGDDGMTAELFGAPVAVTGNTIDFDPTFAAQSDNGGAVTVNGQLNFMVVAGAGKVIDNIQFSEAGDTSLNGSPSADFAVTSVFTPIFIDILEIDGTPVNQTLNINTQMVFTPSDGDYVLSVDGSPITFNYSTIWTGLAQIDINQFLIDQQIDFVGGATKINVALNNILTANSEDGSSAVIAKKDFDGLTVTTNVPEPSSAILVLLAVSGAAVARRS